MDKSLMVGHPHITLASEKDSELLLRIWSELSVELPEHHFAPFGVADFESLQSQQADTLQSCLKRDDTAIFKIGDDSNRICATVSVILNEHVGYSEPKSAVLFNMWVDPSSRKQGLASALIVHAKEWLRQKGVTSVQAGWHPQNMAADQLWRKHGFAAYELIGAALI